MEALPDVDDLRLVREVADCGSIGAAARHLQVSQPSASQRLARLERRVGLALFDRDTRGARPTPAGRELARQADHILGHLEGAFDATRAAAAQRHVRLGTFPSLAELVLPLVDQHLETPVEHVVDHGGRLLAWVAEGTLDAAVIGVAEHYDLPAGVRAHRIGRVDATLFVPAGVEPPRGRRPLRDRSVVFATYDASTEALFRAIVGAGGLPRRAGTVPTALATARATGCLAALPASGAADLRDGERCERLPFRHTMTLSLAVPTGQRRLLPLVDVLRRGLRLT